MFTTINYNISEVRSNLYNNLVHYSQLETEDLNSETLATYFQKLNFNIIKYCEETYSVQSQYSIDFESETETSNKGKQKLKQYSRTTPNTPILPKTTAKHLQTPEQKTSVKLPLSITPFPISFVQLQTPSSLLKCFSRPEDYQLPRNPTQQQKPISTSANIINYLQENKSNYSESLESKETESKQKKTTENEEKMATAYIAKIPEFIDENNNTSPQKWLDKVQKAEDANGWIAILDQFIAGLKDKLIKKIRPYAPADLATAIRHAKNYEMAMKEANHTKLVNLAIGETSSAAEKKINQLTNKLVLRNFGQQRPNHYHTQPSYLTIPEKSDFQQTALSEGKVATPRSNSSNHTILLAQIAQNANLSNIFPFEFKANESPFLLSNAAVNEQKAITAMYTEATVEEKPICLILDNRLAGNRPAQTVIVTADEKAPVFEFEEEKKIPFTETYMALGSPSNWAEETEQEIFKESRGWKKVRYFTPEP
ncbi:hypothetical protein G9A89_014095 [Geosiphon pyriformis]|nr:hypothetical protein G9A89_014095 [Geosiphon pyriformis]